MDAPGVISMRDWVVCAAWAGMVLAGMGSMVWYENAPGTAGRTPMQVSEECDLKLASDRPTLVMYAHPHCPCTRASLEELAKLLAQCPGKADVHVFFFKPKDSDPGWAKSGVWAYAEAIPEVTVSCDEDGRQAASLGAETSGHVVLYAQDGSLMFSGGITPSRGHEGDNAGRSALTALLTDGACDTRETFVFGCPLAAKNRSADLGAGSCPVQR